MGACQNSPRRSNFTQTHNINYSQPPTFPEFIAWAGPSDKIYVDHIFYVEIFPTEIYHHLFDFQDFDRFTSVRHAVEHTFGAEKCFRR